MPHVNLRLNILLRLDRLSSLSGKSTGTYDHEKSRGENAMRRIGLPAALIGFVLSSSSVMAADLALTPQFDVTGGAVVGVQQGNLSVFKGIPFAAPPVRELRWRAPAPIVPWSGVRIADRYSPMCLQALRAKNSVFYLGEEPTSEDCLYLNVWSPDARPAAKLPVMVFVFGGGWTIGSGSLPLYAGEGLARKGAVVVTFNYRVGALGFLSHPELTAELNRGASGNYGLMDIVAALGWVRDNISRFGGDPESVTLYGQSAGAAAIALIETSPLANGLFHRVIGQSGGFGLGGAIPSLADAEQKGVALAETLKAPSLQALRQIGGDAMTAAAFSSRPNIDGYVLPKAPAEAYRMGEVVRVPALVGSNADEGTAYPVAMSAAAFTEDARKRYGARADALLSLYPVATDAEARKASYRAASRSHVRIGGARVGARAIACRAGLRLLLQSSLSRLSMASPISSKRRPRRLEPITARRWPTRTPRLMS